MLRNYLEKNWPTFYGGRGGEYPGEGSIKLLIIKMDSSGTIVNVMV